MAVGATHADGHVTCACDQVLEVSYAAADYRISDDPGDQDAIVGWAQRHRGKWQPLPGKLNLRVSHPGVPAVSGEHSFGVRAARVTVCCVVVQASARARAIRGRCCAAGAFFSLRQLYKGIESRAIARPLAATRRGRSTRF